ncbi:MobP2 family relaxase [Enterococcus thailandicus]|uniref:MobP2 family relaxase n=1 Tax=Enterococcus thailandicus TaxID=417368 RepID=UPI0035DDB188
MSNSPGIILTCQFTLPNKKSFSTYVDYITREQALESIEHRTHDEEQELQKIRSALEEFYIVEGETFSENKSNKNLSDTDYEAQSLMENGIDFEQLEDQYFTKYLSYMTRHYALEQKKDMSASEEKEYKILDKEIKKYKKEPHEKASGKLPGVFSIASDEMKGGDLKKVKKIFQEGQQKGSIIYQDVVSHDNSYLEKMGLYDSSTNTLDEKGLMTAGRKMMDTLFEKEQLQETGYWMATIHRNTKHIHIHFAVVEKENTRKPYTQVENGISYTVPKGKRRQATLDAMKTTYAHELERFAYEKGQVLDMEKRNLLTRKSDLRNSLTQAVKQPNKYDPVALNLLKQVYKNLPEKRSEWNYGDENRTKLSPEVRESLDALTKHLLTKEPGYQEYIKISSSLKKEAQSLYGVTKRETKDAEKNALFDLKKRTGNAILTELKKQDSQIKSLTVEKNQSHKKSNGSSFKSIDRLPTNKQNYSYEETQSKIIKFNKLNQPQRNKEQYLENNQLPTDKYKYSYEEFQKKRKQFQQRIVVQRSLRQLNQTINAHEEKYQANKTYEEQQRRIQYEQERQ